MAPATDGNGGHGLRRGPGGPLAPAGAIPTHPCPHSDGKSLKTNKMDETDGGEEGCEGEGGSEEPRATSSATSATHLARSYQHSPPPPPMQR